MRSIRFLDSDAVKFIHKLNSKQSKQVFTKVMDLAASSTPHDSIVMKNLGLHRATCGEYRIVYKFDDEFLDVVVIGNRNDRDVYKTLKRKIK